MSAVRQAVRFDLSARGARRTLLLIVGIAFVLYAVALDWGLPSWRGWAPDEIEPQTVLKGMEEGFAGRWTTRYPPLHYYLLAAIYAPLGLAAGPRLLDLDPASSHHLYFLAGRWLSVVMATATIWLVYRCSRVYHDRLTSCLAAASAALIAPLTYYAKTANLEAPYLFWFALSLLFYARILRHQRLSDYLLFAATAACAVGTKDQTYALYVLPILMLPPILARYRRRTECSASGPLAVLLDRRLWWGAVVGLAVFAAIHKLPFDLAGFRHHIFEMRRVSAPSAEFGNSLGGHLSLAVAGLRLTAFDLGLPLSLAALAGVVMAALERSWKMLALLAFTLSYHLFFVVVIRYSYDRFYLPVALVLTLFAARALARLVRWQRLPPVAVAMVLAVVFGFSALRAATVDAMLLSDSRYVAEAWLEERLEEGESAVAAGRAVKLHPRGLEHMPWSNHDVGAIPEWLAQGEARYLVLHEEDPWARADLQVVDRLLLGDLNFRPVAELRGRPALDLLRLDGVRTNLTKINGRIVVSARVAEWGAHLDDAVREAVAALGGGDATELEAVAREISTTAIPGRRQLVGDLVIGLSGERHRPIRPGRPAIVVVTNPGDVGWAVELQIGLAVETPGTRARVVVRGERELREVVVGPGPPTVVAIGPVPAGVRQVFSLSTDGEDPVVLKMPLRRAVEPGVWAAGVTTDLWTEGAAPAAIVIDNPTDAPRGVRVGLNAPPDRPTPLTVRAFGVAVEATYEIEPRRKSTVELPPAPPFGRSAILLTAPTAGDRSDHPRDLGFRIIPTSTADG